MLAYQFASMPEIHLDFARSPGFLFADLNGLVRREFDRRIRRFGLTRAQWLVLFHLARQPGCSQSELAELLQIGKISVGRHAERLIRAGWIARRDHAEDGRAYLLHLTPRAERMVARLTPVAEQLRGEYLAGISRARREALIDDLMRIKQNLLGLEAIARR